MTNKARTEELKNKVVKKMVSIQVNLTRKPELSR